MSTPPRAFATDANFLAQCPPIRGARTDSCTVLHTDGGCVGTAAGLVLVEAQQKW